MGLPKRKPTMSRRGFLKKASNATKVIGATAIGGKVAIELMHTLQAKRQQETSRLALRATQLRAAKIPNHTKWARLTEIYKLDPINKLKDREFVNTINAVSKTVGLTPERTLLTIELNDISAHQISALKTNLQAHNYNKKEKERRKRIIHLLGLMTSETLTYKEREIYQKIKKRISSTRGSLNKLESFARTQK